MSALCTQYDVFNTAALAHVAYTGFGKPLILQENPIDHTVKYY